MSTERICEGRVVAISGAGRGLGREHALEFARRGAKVVINDIGAEMDGSGSSSGPAGEVVDEIRGMGGEAVANGDDVADWDGAANFIQAAIDAFGQLDTLVCNAGILRDRMLVNMTEDDWDAVMRVHLKGHFCPLRHAARYWREKSKEGEQPVARVVLTSSPAGLYGNIGQINYGAAKSAIATMAKIAGAELSRYGVKINAIAPAARTRMTDGLFEEMAEPDDPSVFDIGHPANVSPLVVWLGSPDCDVTGQTFDVTGGRLTLAENWRKGPTEVKKERWDVTEIGPAVRDMVAKVEHVPVIGAQ